MSKQQKGLLKGNGKAARQSVRSSSGKPAIKRDSAGRFTSSAKPTELTLEERSALAKEIKGKYAYVKMSSYDFMEQKQRDILAEDRRWQP